MTSHRFGMSTSAATNPPNAVAVSAIAAWLAPGEKGTTSSRCGSAVTAGPMMTTLDSQGQLLGLGGRRELHAAPVGDPDLIRPPCHPRPHRPRLVTPEVRAAGVEP